MSRNLEVLQFGDANLSDLTIDEMLLRTSHLLCFITAFRLSHNCHCLERLPTRRRVQMLRNKLHDANSAYTSAGDPEHFTMQTLQRRFYKLWNEFKLALVNCFGENNDITLCMYADYWFNDNEDDD